jgi:hypothetical protein
MMMKQLLVLTILCAMTIGAFWFLQHGQTTLALILLGLVVAVPIGFGIKRWLGL